MEILAKFCQKTDERKGVSSNGEWVSGQFLIDTQEKYFNVLAIDFFGKEIADVINSLTYGEQIRVGFNIVSREYQGKYYTNLKCYACEPLGALRKPTTQKTQPQQPASQGQAGQYVSVFEQGGMPVQQVGEYEQAPF